MIGTYFVVLVVFIGALFLWLPRLSRRELFFAVTVPADFPKSESGRAILRAFDVRVVVATLCGAALAAWGATTARFGLALAAPLIVIGGCFWAFLRARADVRPHAVTPTIVREARLAPHQIRLPGGWVAQLGPFAILAAAAIFLRTHWQRIPERFPIHWGLNGQPNGWSTRTMPGVFGPLWMGVVIVALLVFLSWGILHWTRKVHASGSAAEVELARERRILLLLLFTEYILAGTVTWTALLPLRAAPQYSPSMALPLALIVVFVLVLPLLFVVHRPIEPAPAAGAAPVGDRTEDRYWKAGVFYFNREDPALMVEKRFGIGYTLNFGHRIAWVLLGAILLLPVVVIAATVLLRSH